MTPKKKKQGPRDNIGRRIPTVEVTNPDSTMAETGEDGGIIHDDPWSDHDSDFSFEADSDAGDDSDVEESPMANIQPPNLAQDEERTQAMAVIKKNWGSAFDTLSACIPEDTWIKGASKDMTELTCEINTIRRMRDLSDNTKGKGNDMKNQIGLLWAQRHRRGGLGRSDGPLKEKNLRDDLEKLRNGHREWPKGPGNKRKKMGNDVREEPILAKRTRGGKAPDYNEMDPPEAPEDDQVVEYQGPSALQAAGPAAKTPDKRKKKVARAPGNDNAEDGQSDEAFRQRELEDKRRKLRRAEAAEEEFEARVSLTKTEDEHAVIRREAARRETERCRVEMRQAGRRLEGMGIRMMGNGVEELEMQGRGEINAGVEDGEVE